MLLIFFLLCGVLALRVCPPLSLPFGESKVKQSRPEGERTINLYIPKSYNASAEVPLVVHWHGWTDSCDNFGGHCQDAHCNFFEESEARGFIFAAVCGYDGSFNAGTCCPPANTLSLNDVQLARELVGNLSSELCLDAGRIFTTGFSNGAMMSQILICEAFDVFAAAGSVAGVVELAPGNEEGLALCNASYSKKSANVVRNVLDVHGTADTTVPMGGDPFLGFPPVPENMAKWASRNGCSGAAPKTTWRSPNGDFYNLVFDGCSGGKVERIVHPFTR